MNDNLLMSASGVLSVTELNRSIRELLETNVPLMWIGGEISGLTRAASGHWYFSLKDKNAQVSCVMFRSRNAYLDWQPREGDHIEVRALVSLYEARGEFQLTIETMRQAGMGSLYEAFEKLKARLQAEGLFDSAKKQTLPACPKQIGIITSPVAAALNDILTTLKRRMPSISVVIYPTPVQGKSAAASIAAAIGQAANRAECDVLMVCRGGGSIEDLWSFNEEIVARAIATCSIPVISGVGHETDFTIVDFVADVRAPTPTAAAELASPDQKTQQQQLLQIRMRLLRAMNHKLTEQIQKLDYLACRMIHPGERINQRREKLLHLQLRLNASAQQHIEQGKSKLQSLPQRLVRAGGLHIEQRSILLGALEQSLSHLNPENILERGYSMVRMENGDLVRSSKQLKDGDSLQISFAEGQAEAIVGKRQPRLL